MKKFTDQAREMYDVILIDTPPVNVVTDAQILSNIADGSILVVRSEKTEIEDAKRAVEALESAKAKILGTILNDLDKSSSTNYYYYYGQN